MVDEHLLRKPARVEEAAERARRVGDLIEDSGRKASQALDRVIEAQPMPHAAPRPPQARGSTGLVLPELSALDDAIRAGRAFENDMQELIDQLTNELEDLGRRVTVSKDFTAVERIKALLSQRWANRSRLRRIRRQAIDGSMRTVLAYAEGTVSSINDQIERNTEVYQSLVSRLQLLSAKLKDNQPRYQHWRERSRSLDTERLQLVEQLSASDEDQRPQLQEQLNELQVEIDQARVNETAYFEIVRNAEEAVELVRHHAEGFKQSIDALVRAKFKTAEKIDNLTEVFTGIYQIIETSLEMKGFSRIDQTLNYAADRTTDTMNRQLEGILEEARVRNSRPLIDDEKLEAYIRHMRSIIERFSQAVEEQRKRYAKRGRAAW